MAPSTASVAADERVLGPAAFRRSPLVAAAVDADEALARARAWAAGAVPGARIDRVRVGSLLYRPDGGCTLRYDVRLSPSERDQILLVEVPPAGTGIVVRPFPDDPALPTLPLALDPVSMRQVLGRALSGTAGEHRIGHVSVDVVRYPRRGRCVLRYRLSPDVAGRPDGLHHPVVFGKVYADDTAVVAASAARLLRAGLRAVPDAHGLDVPRPLGVVASLRMGLAEAVAGRPRLPERLKAACATRVLPGASESDELFAAVVAAARMVAAVHTCAPGRTPLPARDLSGERASTDAELALLEPIWPDVAHRLRQGLDHALRAHREYTGRAAPGWAVSRVVAHGDFTPGQVLIDDDGRTALVDVDTLCLAEPALDLGRFLAYLHVAAARRSRTAWPLVGDLPALFLASYTDARAATGAAPLGTSARRLLGARTAMFRALVLARIGASACWQLKDDRLRAVVDVMDAGNDWMRSVAG
jgi:aminoglycoside phosphotransferase (APT) family kinase protein